MRNQRFGRVRERLLRGGVAPRHVRRTITELEGHFADIVSELQSTGLSEVESESRAAVRLGSEDVLVASVLARPELRSWSRRWPWFAFGLLPLMIFASLFLLSIMALLQTVEFAQHSLGWTPARSPELLWLRDALVISAMWLAPLIAAAGTCLLAARRRAPIAWPLVTTILIGILSALTTVTLEWPASAPRGIFSAGLGLSSTTMANTIAHAIIAIALVLIPYFWWRRTVPTPGSGASSAQTRRA